MTSVTNPQKCTGCLACRLICPEECIGAAEDSEGFAVPQIESSRCLECGLCVSRCPENSAPGAGLSGCLRVLAAKSKDDAILRCSASGGVFAGLAKKILETPGNAVFGCAYDENLAARHICVTDPAGLPRLQSSKYVQSDTGDTYLQAKALLDAGKTVFYTGTPCQIAGLRAFLGAARDNLLTADLVCHGVPSPLLFAKYLRWLGRKHGGQVISYNFRSKERDGWGLTSRAVIKTGSRSKTRFISPYADPYYDSFLNCRTFRECCYTCRYAGSRRAADFSIGDYWGIDKVDPGFFDSKGVSVVLINTDKGARWFEKVAGGFDTVETAFADAASHNINLTAPSCRPGLRDCAYDGVSGAGAGFFRSPAYRIRKDVYFKTLVKTGLKRILPPAAIEKYRNVKRMVRM